MQDFLENNKPYLRPKTRWRRMLVLQPPITTLAYLERNITPSDTVILHCRENPLQAFGGLRMNKLYDLVLQTAHITSRRSISISECVGRGTRRTRSGSSHLGRIQILHPSKLVTARNRSRMPLRVRMLFLICGIPIVCRARSSPSGRKDTWTRDLVEGLQAPMGDLKARQVLRMRELKDAKIWFLSNRERSRSPMHW